MYFLKIPALFLMFQTIDQLGKEIQFKNFPTRIISLVPSQTELLYDLGLTNEVVGITKFCIHPEIWYRSKTRIGGTKNINLKKIAALQPDLIIGNKEENSKEQIQQLMQLYPVWMSDIKTLADALNMIGKIGELVNRKEKANEIITQIKSNFATIINPLPKTCAYFIWKNPYLCAGSDTFIDAMLQACSFQNVFSNLSRYPEINLQKLEQMQPEVILLSSEPYPFKEADKAHLQKICPGSKIQLVDGEMFSWYGSRLLKSPAYFNTVINNF